MKKLLSFGAGALLALIGAQPAFAGHAVAALGAYTGEEIFYEANFTNFELNWVDDPSTVGGPADPTPIAWGIGLDLGAPPAGDEKFAVLTGISAGAPAVVVCPAHCGIFAGTVLDDITLTDAAAFASYISAGAGTSNLAVFGTGEIGRVEGVTSAINKDFTRVAPGVYDVASQVSFTLNGLPISGIVAGAGVGSLTTNFGPGGTLAFVEDHSADFDPRDLGGSAGRPLTTAEFSFATGDYAGAGTVKDANSLGAGTDAGESSYLTWAYAPVVGTHELSLNEQWPVSLVVLPGPILGVTASGHSVVASNGITYYVQGTSDFVDVGRPFLLTGGSAAALFSSSPRWEISGQTLFGQSPTTSLEFGHVDDPATFTFVSDGVGARPKIRGGPVGIIPEVSSLWMLGMGLSGLGVLRGRKFLG